MDRYEDQDKNKTKKKQKKKKNDDDELGRVGARRPVVVGGFGL